MATGSGVELKGKRDSESGSVPLPALERRTFWASTINSPGDPDLLVMLRKGLWIVIKQ